jgi:hypothetical protein
MPDLGPNPPLASEEAQAREAERLNAARLRLMLWRALNDRDIVAPRKIGALFGMPRRDAVNLLDRKQWREGDLLLLEAAAARLGLQVPGLDPWRP